MILYLYERVVRRQQNIVFFLLFSTFLSPPLQAQNALFTASDSSGCVPFSVQFNNLSSGANSFHWNFGNGTTSSLPDPMVAYLTPGSFTVTLVATNTFTGNSDTLTAIGLINIADDPIASFTASPLSACVNSNSIVFNNSSTNALTYIWDFGDGNASTLSNPTHTYSNAGTYTVKLIASNTNGCTDLAEETNYINIHPKPDASFTVNFTSSCDSSDTFIFSNNAPGISTWQWDFGDGNTSALANPSHVYGMSGSFDVTLIASNSNGCYDTVIYQNYINIGTSLTPGFSVSSQSGCAPLNIQFNAAVPNATTWQWDFGDGTSSSSANPTHNYLNPGSYPISLTVTTAGNCNGSVTIPNFINVYSDPQSNFSLSTNQGCVPLTVNFTNHSIGAANYVWYFGDGNSSALASPSHTYTGAGSFDVTLISFNAAGCADTLTLNNAVIADDIIAGFNATPQIGCSVLPVDFTSSVIGTPVSWHWDFGDGNTSNTSNPSNNYVNINSYDVTLIVSSALGCNDTLRRNNFIDVVPDTTAYTVPDTINGCAPEPLSFFDPTTGSNVWSWDFGDGDTSIIQNPSHIYYYPGIYIVTLNTVMAGGCTQSFEPYAIVKIDSFIIDDSQITQITDCPPFQFSFSNATAFVNGYHWNFGDGNSSDLPAPTHSYQNSGTYFITLSLTMENGCVIIVDDSVTVGYPNPILSNGINFCLGDTVILSLSDTLAFTAATWDFGDSSTAVGFTVEHIYANVGNYHISVALTDTIGCLYIYELSGDITVRDPIPAFTVSPEDTACDILTANFINLSTNANSYWWGFGDGSSSADTDPIHTYNTPGTYNVTLFARNTGCIRSITVHNAIVVNSAVADFTFLRTSYCLPSGVLFSDSSVNAVSWQWDFGNGNTSDGPTSFQVYQSQSTGPVTLQITDVNGCSDSISKFINFANTTFTSDDTLGCAPLSVNFTSNIGSALSWYWDFGDGSTSSQAQPTHTYTADGTYDVMLIVSYPEGCSDTVRYQNYIQVSTATASFSSPTVSVCAPSEVLFHNHSQNAHSYIWNFGDGVTSTEFEPSHIYNIPGYYTVTLIAFSDFGCSDTLVMQDYIEIPGSYAQFTYVPQIGCETFSAQFNDLSVNASNWLWNFGDGSVSTLQNPLHTFSDTGTYVVSLIVSDTGNCNSFISLNVHVQFNYFPVASGHATSPGGCLPYAMPFINTSSANTASVLWLFGDGNNSTDFNPTHTYNNAGLYYPTLVAFSSAGCSDTLQFNTAIEILQTPTALFSADADSGCYGTTFNFLNQSSGLQSPSFYWYFSNGSTSSLVNPVVTLYQAGLHSVSLNAVNANGCSDSIYGADLIYIADTLAPAPNPILSASVNSENKIEITWENSSDTDLKAYELYRFNPATAQFELIYTDLNPSNSAQSYSSSFTDSLVDPSLHSQSYRLRTIDECDQAEMLSNIVSYTTIELQAQEQGGNVHLSWNAYGGCPVSAYTIERSGPGTSAAQVVAVVDSLRFQFTDTSIYCPGTYVYRITGSDLCGNNYESHSDTAIAKPAHPIELQEVEIVRTTVTETEHVLTEWLAPAVLPDRVIAYLVLRSDDQINFLPIATVGMQENQYLDQNVNVHELSYSYKIIPVNDCQLRGSSQNAGNSILLTGDKPDDFHTILQWNRYEGWADGVQKYVIEKLDENNNWKLIEVVGGNTHQLKLKE